MIPDVPMRLSDPRAVLAELEGHARKRFGQHFLARADVVDRIVRMAGVERGDRILEVGPGLGVLSERLIAAGGRVTAVEVDGDLVHHLRTRVPELELVHADATRLDWAVTCPGEGWKMVANLPYNVGTGLFMDLARRTGHFVRLTAMLQAEVVARMVARPGDDAYGAMSVQLQARGEATAMFDVPPSAFVPPPKVVSTVVRVDLFAAPNVGPAGPDAFDRVVRAAFAQRRKTLRNALGAVFGKDDAVAALHSVGIDPMARAETIDGAGFRALASALVGG